MSDPLPILKARATEAHNRWSALQNFTARRKAAYEEALRTENAALNEYLGLTHQIIRIQEEENK